MTTKKVYECPNCLEENDVIQCESCHCVYGINDKVTYFRCGICHDTMGVEEKGEMVPCPNCNAELREENNPGITIEFHDGSKTEISSDPKHEAELCHKKINELYRENTRLRVVILYMIMSYLLVLGIGIWIGGLK